MISFAVHGPWSNLLPITDQLTVTTISGNTQRADSTYNYYEDTNHDGIYGNTGDLYKGVPVHVSTTNSSSVTGDGPTNDTVNSYAWWDQAVMSGIVYKPDVNGSTSYATSYTYDALGHLTSVFINDARPRTVSFVSNQQGQIMLRSEHDNNNSTGDPVESHYYFNNQGMGVISNNGPGTDVDLLAMYASHQTVPGNGPFNGASSGTQFADADASYDPINGMTMQASATTYTVQDGDTLQSISAQMWGDSSFWYLIADANGLNGSETLPAGYDLIIPSGVHNVHNNASTYSVFNPNTLIGNTQPTTMPTPPPPKHGGCGIIGMIIVAIIAVVATVLTAGAAAMALYPGLSMMAALGSLGLGEGIAVGALAGVVGNVVSQGAGMAMGIQKSFNWGAVGMAAIGGAVSGGLGASGVFSGISSSLSGTIGTVAADFVQGAVTGAAGSALSQGVDMAVGLQKKFDWTGVAAAGVGGGIASAVSGQIPGAAQYKTVNTANGPVNVLVSPADQLNVALSGMAGAIANAGTRTLINGSDFGDNLIAALPDVIGNTIGNLIGHSIEGDIHDALSSSDAPIGGSTGATSSANASSVNGQKIYRVDYTATQWDDNGNETAATIDKYVLDPSTGRERIVSSQAAASQDMPALNILDNLGDDVAAIGSQSPTLLADLTALYNENVGIGFGTVRGSGTNKDYEIDTGKFVITENIALDPALQGNAAGIVQALSHEVGHALYTSDYDHTSAEGYDSSQTKDEGAATISNIQIQKEILQNTGGAIDIGIAGKQTADFGNIYNQYKSGSVSLDSAETRIGNLYKDGEDASGTGTTYRIKNTNYYNNTILPNLIRDGIIH